MFVVDYTSLQLDLVQFTWDTTRETQTVCDCPLFVYADLCKGKSENGNGVLVPLHLTQQSWQPGTQDMTFHRVPDFNSHYDFD